jgi:GAF domain-containing protein
MKPIETLSNIAQQFARGNWEQRAEINRDDEIGLLSFSFNQMANDLQELYRSLEAKVNQRSQQLRTASEVALLATSGTNRDEMIQQAVDLLKDRFNYFYSAIFMLDETGEYADLRAAATTDENLKLPAHLRVQVGTQSVIGQVTATQNPMIITDLDDERAYKQADSVMPTSGSEITVPMMLGTQMLGVIDVQSQSVSAFDSDTLIVLQTLANQLATGLRNVLLVESSQVNLEETAILYRSSRQITQASNETEILRILTESFSRTNFVALLLSVEVNDLKIVSFHDPKNVIVDDSLNGISLPLQRGADRLIENAILIIDDLQAAGDFENLTAFLARRNCRSAALIPIVENRQPTKLIALGTRESIPLSSTRLQPYASLAEVASTSLDRFSVMKTLQERLNDLQVLEYVGQAVSAETDPLQLYRTLNDIIFDQIGNDISFAVAIHNSKENLIEIPYMISGGRQLNVAPMPLGEGLTSYLLQTQKPLLLNSKVEETAQSFGAKSIGASPKSWLGIPLMIAGDAIGAIIMQDMANENRFEQADVNLFSTIAPQIATALRNAQLISEMSVTVNAFEQEHFLLDILLSNLPDRVSFKDKELHYLRVSQSLSNDYGHSDPEEFIGKDDGEIIGGEQGQEMLVEERQILESGQPLVDVIEKTVDDKNNDNWRVISKLPMIDKGGNTLGLLGISRDVTAVKKAEELAQIRAQRLMTASEIARDTSGMLDLETLLKNAVNLVLDRFGFYHASIFLIDPLGENAILRESTGDAGMRMKNVGHKLAVGSSSIVGQATSRGEPLVVNEVRRYEFYYPNPLLPDTRAEMALPLTIANRVLGALDVQSTKVNAFTQEDVHTLQILADQIAIAIMNAELFSSAQETLAQHRFLHQITSAASTSQNVEEALRTTAQGMQVARKEDRISIHILNENNELILSALSGFPAGQRPKDIIPVGEGIIGRVALDKHAVRVADVLTDPFYVPTGETIHSQLAVPIIYTDRLMGVLNLESEKVAAYSENDEEILSTMGNNLGSIIANAQLVSRIQHQVELQKQIFDISSRIRRSVDMNAILETSANELGKALRAQKATIRISIDPDRSPKNLEEQAPGNNNGHNNGSKSNGKAS